MKSFTNLRAMLVSMALCSTPALADQGSPAPGNWPSYVEGLAPIGERMAAQLTDPKDPQLEQELYRLMYLTMAQGYFALVYQDSEYPDFWPQFNQAFNFGITNPDDTYYTTPIKATGVYRIRGFRGSARLVDFQIGSGEFFYRGLGAFGPTLRNYDLDKDVHLGKNGAFDVVLSAERPKAYKGDWWPLDPMATHLFVRQISYDWVNEVDGRFAIDRMDLPAARPRDSAEKIASQLKHIPEVTQNWTQWTLNYTAKMREKGLVNKIAVVDLAGLGGLSTQKYMDGLFDIGPDEALILETEIPKNCRYWGFVVYHELWAILDWQNRQSSLNGHTARMDRDRKFRAVISAQDPGVPNWLDTSGYQRGGMFGPFNHCEGNQQPTLTKIKLADVRKYLPADTPAFSAEQRDAAIRLRRMGTQLRRRW